MTVSDKLRENSDAWSNKMADSGESDRSNSEAMGSADCSLCIRKQDAALSPEVLRFGGIAASAPISAKHSGYLRKAFAPSSGLFSSSFVL